LITQDYKLEGYTNQTKLFLLSCFLNNIFGQIIIFITLQNYSVGDFVLLQFGLQLYKRAFETLIEVLSTLISTSILFIFLWLIKDKRYSNESIREQKKGALPWLYTFPLLFIIIKIIPIIIFPLGRLRQITNTFDVVGFFLALFLGLWQLLNLKQRLEPLKGWERINPI